MTFWLAGLGAPHDALAPPVVVIVMGLRAATELTLAFWFNCMVTVI